MDFPICAPAAPPKAIPAFSRASIRIQARVIGQPRATPQSRKARYFIEKAHMNDFHFFEKLGEGSFAEVFKVYSNKRRKYFAMKRLKKRYKIVEDVKNLPELTSLQLLQGHPNIIRLEDALYDRCNGSVHLLLELCDVNLAELIEDNQSPFEERVALTITYQILKAVAFMPGKLHGQSRYARCQTRRFRVNAADGLARAVHGVCVDAVVPGA